MVNFVCIYCIFWFLLEDNHTKLSKILFINTDMRKQTTCNIVFRLLDP
jgi:hypothetical protein